MKTVVFILAAMDAVLCSSNFKFTRSRICNSFVIPYRLSVRTVWSETACASVCTETKNCISYTFSSETGLCSLYSGIASNAYTCNADIDYGHLPVQSCTNAILDIRLCDGNGTGIASPSRGRVEIYYNGVWGTVCDDGWNPGLNQDMNAKVVCNLFGYGNFDVNMTASFGQGSDPIHLDDLMCTGSESSLSSCQHLPWDSHNCAHSEDVGVTCF